MTEFNITCKRCRKDFIVTAETNDERDWKNGALIQDALHYLSADDRELLMSGICGTCFDRMFPP